MPSDTVEKFKNFFSDSKIQDLLNNNEFEELYNLIDKQNIGIDVTGKLTDLLYNIGIDPLKYMDIVPDFFAWRSNRDHFNIPDTINYIGRGAFDCCYNLKDIYIPQGVTKINWATFRDCKSLKEVFIPDSVNSIEDAFSGCTSLEKVSLPGGVNLPFYSAFNNCDSLKEIEYRGTINQYANSLYLNSFIGKDVITNDGRLSDLTYLNPSNLSGITKIGESAFYGCTNLEKVEIPTNIIKIGANVFIKCPKLKSIKYMGTIRQWANVDIDKDNKKLRKLRVFCSDGEYTI